MESRPHPQTAEGDHFEDSGRRLQHQPLLPPQRCGTDYSGTGHRHQQSNGRPKEKQIEAAKETRDFILRNYEIGTIYTIKLMTTGINNPSIVFRVYTDKGDFIFKALTKDESHARYIVNFQNALVKKGLQVPELIPLKNADKSGVLAQKDGLYFILERSLPAGNLTPAQKADFRHYKEFAAYNAIIDNIVHSKDYVDEEDAPRRPEVYDMIVQTRKEYVRLKESIEKKLDKTEADKLALENFDFIMEQIRLFKERFTPEIQSGLVRSVSSFDITFNNVFFDDETKNIAGAFDFGGTSLAPRVLAFDYMFNGIYGPFYREFSYRYNGYDIIKEAYKEYNKIVNLKLTPQELIGALEISRGRFIYNLVYRRFINREYGANIFSHPERIGYAYDNMEQFKKFASDFNESAINYFINYVLYGEKEKAAVVKEKKLQPSNPAMQNLLSAA